MKQSSIFQVLFKWLVTDSIVEPIKKSRQDLGLSDRWLFKRFAMLFWKHGFWPVDVVFYGLAHPQASEQDIAACLPSLKLVRIQTILNPQPFLLLSIDKVICAQVCSGAGIPVPKTLAITNFPGGLRPGGLAIRNKEEWKDFFHHQLPDEFVIKPAHGAGGEDILVFSRQQGAFVELAQSNGKPWTFSDIFDFLERNAKKSYVAPSPANRALAPYSRFVIQERIHNHPDLQALSDTNGLQTVRIMTVVDRTNTVKMIFATLKIIVGDNMIDNFRGGETGNFLLSVALATGITGEAATPTGIQRTAVHPRTGIPLSGMQLPHWQTVSAMLQRAALAFLPLRTLGWDVAITPTGACVIETNNYYTNPGFSLGAYPGPEFYKAQAYMKEELSQCFG